METRRQAGVGIGAAGRLPGDGLLAPVLERALCPVGACSGSGFAPVKSMQPRLKRQGEPTLPGTAGRVVLPPGYGCGALLPEETGFAGGDPGSEDVRKARGCPEGKGKP